MPYSLKPDNDVLCQCGCIVKKYYMPKHLLTIKHAREMQGRDNIEVVDHHRYKPRNIRLYIYMYECVYIGSLPL